MDSSIPRAGRNVIAVPFLVGAITFLIAAEFTVPAGDRYVRITGTASILPGGRVIQPQGQVIETGSGSFALAISPKGTVATADLGPDRFGITLISRLKEIWQTRELFARTPFSSAPEAAEPDWKGVSSGIVFETERSIWIAEGSSGRVRLVDANSGNHLKIVDLNQGESRKCFTGALALDARRRLLFAVDQTNGRLVVVDTKKGQLEGSVRVGRMPVALALSAGGESAYVANAGDGNVTFVDVSDPLKPVVTESVPTGSSPSGVLVSDGKIFVSDSASDSVSVLDAATHKVVAEVALRIPGLNELRGILPTGLAFDPPTRWLLVAEAGINAVGVIDTHTNTLLAHIPAGWFPTAVAIVGDRVFVANMRGRGTGPNLRRPLLDLGEPAFLHRGTVSTFVMPAVSELPKLTGLVYGLAGLAPHASTASQPELPAAIEHVVLIVKESRAFDEVLGDIGEPDKAVAAMPQLARFGMHGIADGNRVRFSVHDAAITPNQHAMARRWAFDDNFYADSDTDAEGLRWLAGRYPDAFEISRQFMPDGASALQEHLGRHGISVLEFRANADASEDSDQHRADQFIAEMTRTYGKGGKVLPRFVSLVLPNDHLGPQRPADGYPYKASYVEDNDLALGRILAYLSETPWWPHMTVFVTEASAQGGLDHVDSHRTLLLAAGPWVKRNYISHTNGDFAALLKTVLQLLRAPPLNLMDASAARLNGIFATNPDFTPYQVEIPDKRVFDAGR